MEEPQSRFVSTAWLVPKDTLLAWCRDPSWAITLPFDTSTIVEAAWISSSG